MIGAITWLIWVLARAQQKAAGRWPHSSSGRSGGGRRETVVSASCWTRNLRAVRVGRVDRMRSVG